MLKSMTGFGIAEGRIGTRRLTVEAKSVNHKFCEVNLRVPPRYSSLEPFVIEFVKSFFKRGRIDIFIREDSGVGAASPVKIDAGRLKSYYRELNRVAKTLKISQEITLNTLIGLPQVLVSEEEDDLEQIWKKIRPLLKKAFESMEKMRKKEGQALARYLEQQIRILSKEVKSIEKLIPRNVEHHHKSLEERIQKLSLGSEVDPQRLAQEIAYFVDRSDISEEIQRLNYHVVHFGDILKGAGPIGRKLDFLLQEMNREINTLSAKAQNAKISQRVVECKHLLEKVREQVQNAE